MQPPTNVTVVKLFDEYGLLLDEIWYPKGKAPTLKKLFARYPNATRIVVL
jgi:hypothetical protein